MKQLPSIKSVQSRVRYEETELKQIVSKQTGKPFFWRKPVKKSVMLVDGYAMLSTYSATVPLRGMIEITFLADQAHTVILQVPSSTYFFITCLEQDELASIPAFAISLS
jgi:hypothetical protein